MGGANLRALIVSAIAVTGVQGVAPRSLSEDDVVRAHAAIREAFAFLYTLPSDTAAASMGSWVLDSDATTPSSDRTGEWRIVATRLTDTGKDLRLEEMVGGPGTSPAQLAAAMAAMQQLEAKISKAEAEASLEVVISVNPTGVVGRPERETAPHSDYEVRGAQLTRLTRGYWTQVEDKELGVSTQRWSPARLLVSLAGERAGEREPGMGIRTVVVTAQGNEGMLERIVKEARWESLTVLVNQ